MPGRAAALAVLLMFSLPFPAAAQRASHMDGGRDFGESETKVGGDVLGGVEYFFNRTATVKAEGRYQFVERTSLGIDPSGFLLMVGLKQYF